MSGKVIAPYGTWVSPLSADLIVSSAVRFGKVCLDGDEVYWSETRPGQNGREIIVHCSPKGVCQDVLPEPFDARTRVHEFGGGSFSAFGGSVYFSNLADQRIYRIKNDGGKFSPPQALTPAPVASGKHLRFADITGDLSRQRLICVQEDHRQTDREAPASIVAVSLDGSENIQTLVSGADFYSSPKVSPDGKRLAWLTWNHPNMPWDAAELWVAEFDETGKLSQSRHVAGGENEAIFQPEWSPNGQLYFVSDRNGWWNLHRLAFNGQVNIAQALLPASAEFGMTHIYFGHSTFAFGGENELFCAFAQNGMWHLGRLDLSWLDFTVIDTSFQEITYLRANANRVVFRGGGPEQPISIVSIDNKSGTLSILRSSLSKQAEESKPYWSKPRAIEFSTAHGQTAHGFFYEPANAKYAAPEGELPPLMVRVHGGPNNQFFSTLDLSTQYWTSRGFAVFDLNYRGSSGFGRAYREKLKGGWGTVEVDDCAYAAQYLIEQGLVDGKRTIVTGMSAGGYATICSVTFKNVFRAGAAYFGICDMESMAESFHKFQSRFLQSMIGPFPERRDLYRAVSAINFVDQIDCPLLVLHGALDSIVPIEQSNRLVSELDARKKPFAYVAFDDEPHVFRKAPNVKQSLEAELSFYGQVFGFKPADAIAKIEIKNATVPALST